MAPSSTAQALGEKSSQLVDRDEQAVLDRQLNGLQDGSEKRKLGPWTYATRGDTVVLVLSSISGIAAGAANPLLVVSHPTGQSVKERVERKLTISVGHLWSTRWTVHRVRQRVRIRRLSSLGCEPFRPLLCLPGNRRVHPDIREHSWLLLVWRAHRTTHAQGVPQRNSSSKHRLL